jgi:hypothetical protein
LNVVVPVALHVVEDVDEDLLKVAGFFHISHQGFIGQFYHLANENIVDQMQVHFKERRYFELLKFIFFLIFFEEDEERKVVLKDKFTPRSTDFDDDFGDEAVRV